MKCPRCKNTVLQKSEQGARVRTKGPLEFSKGACTAKCYWCGEKVSLPLELRKAEPKLVLKPGKTV